MKKEKNENIKELSDEELNINELKNDELNNVSGGVNQDCDSNSNEPLYKVGDIVYYDGSNKYKAQVIEVSKEKYWVWYCMNTNKQYKYKLHYLNCDSSDSWEFEYHLETIGHKD